MNNWRNDTREQGGRERFVCQHFFASRQTTNEERIVPSIGRTPRNAIVVRFVSKRADCRTKESPAALNNRGSSKTLTDPERIYTYYSLRSWANNRLVCGAANDFSVVSFSSISRERFHLLGAEKITRRKVLSPKETASRALRKQINRKCLNLYLPFVKTYCK